MIYELPVKSADVVPGENGGKKFKYTLNGLKTATKEFFYNREDPNGTGVTTDKQVTFSDISFSEQPANAAYKITDTIADLVMTASVSTGKIKSVVWYMNSDQTTGGVDKAIQTDKITDKLTNYRSVLSNLKQYITVPEPMCSTAVSRPTTASMPKHARPSSPSRVRTTSTLSSTRLR